MSSFEQMEIDESAEMNRRRRERTKTIKAHLVFSIRCIVFFGSIGLVVIFGALVVKMYTGKEVGPVNASTTMVTMSPEKEEFLKTLGKQDILLQPITNSTLLRKIDIKLSGNETRQILQKYSWKKSKKIIFDAMINKFGNIKTGRKKTMTKTTNLPEDLPTPIARSERSLTALTTPMPHFRIPVKTLFDASSNEKQQRETTKYTDLNEGLKTLESRNRKIAIGSTTPISHFKRSSKISKKRSKSPAPFHFDGGSADFDAHLHEIHGETRHSRHYADWKESGEVSDNTQNKLFDVNNGTVTIRESGIYFVYAKVYYVNVPEVNAFRVYKNEDTLLQCTGTSQPTEGRFNTCFTAGITYFEKGETIALFGFSNGRYSVFEPGKTFFGMRKLISFNQN